MIRFLRFAGVLIAGVWLGALVFHTFVAGPALNSAAAQQVFGPNFFPYAAPATAQLLTKWYFFLGTICALFALVHLFAENLYMGRGVPRRWLALLLTVVVLNVLGAAWLNPKLTRLHNDHHRRDAATSVRDSAAAAFNTWHGVFQAMNVFMLGSVAALLWRTSNPTDTPRYVSSGKFKS